MTAYRERKKAEDPEAYRLGRNAEVKRYRDRQKQTEDGRLNGKIYVIRNNVNENTYVGSTTGRLAKRLADHKSFSRRGLGAALAAQMAEVAEEHWSIELLESFPAENQAELTAKEREWIERLAPRLNKYKPSHPQREWKAEQRAKGPTTCECGGQLSCGHEARHRQSKQHQSWLKANKPEQEAEKEKPDAAATPETESQLEVESA